MGLENLDLKLIANDEFLLDEKTPISKEIIFKDMIWDFTDGNKERNNSVDNSKLRFNWGLIKERLGASFVEDLKVLVFYLVKAPSIFGRNIGENGEYKINTIHGYIMKFVDILEKILIVKEINFGIHSINSIKSLSDLKLNFFEEIPIPISCINGVKQILRLQTHPLIKKQLNSSINWNHNDVGNLKFKVTEKSNHKNHATKPLDEILFIEISKHITVDIISFKKMMGMEIHSSVPESYIKEIDSKFTLSNFNQAFEDYIEIRELERDMSLERGKRGSYSTNLKKDFKDKNGISVREFYNYLQIIQRAAIFALIQFTGVRYSEVISFKNNCIIKRGDVHLIKGTIIKHKNNLLPTDCDEWVAISIVRDAVDILKEMQRFSFNKYLASSLFSVYLNQKDVPLSLNAITSGLNLYIQASSKQNSKLVPFLESREHKITIHRLRHTLAQQLIRGRLGLPYISFHLKHVNSAVAAYRKVNNVTLGYGGISKEIYQSVKHINSAKTELYNEIYNPASPIAGGKNADEFKKRRKEYFQGIMVNDDEVEEIITDLKKQSLPFLDVGLGYCAGRKDIVLKDGTKQPPPCIGQLRCNPLDCSNAIIPQSKLPVWEKLYQDSYNKLQQEEYSYMNLELKESLQRAEFVISHFNNKEG